MLRSNSKSLGNHVVSPEEEKERLQWEDLQKRKVLTLRGISCSPLSVCPSVCHKWEFC